MILLASLKSRAKKKPSNVHIWKFLESNMAANVIE